MAVQESTDRRRLRGMRTRQAILAHAARVGSAEGLEAVSLQRLATDLGMSKSGLFAHFGSKEELHMATIDAAARIFTDEVIRPALATPRGVGRVWALCNSWLSYLERGVFPGGCFFWAVAEEFDSRRPGPVRDSVLEKKSYWSYTLQRAVREAQEAGDIDPGMDPEQLAWELDSLLGGTNSGFKGDDGPRAIERGRRAIRDRLTRAATRGAKPLV
ncbi:MAG: TetR/AcrR family transcriptional regulator [Chloroflexi bacterium]|nr:MAG: TetR/AcrR family transcriptional regulator [Chloroflexota bacterium]TMG14088.1 MAG: TetR/AcrR family transcriptional regulator [Chloroflexota bacterium]TMG21975.1 MAG: TetR/AcrR family transcriptional regulator [Chloroflexota bacterium]TMG67299.1 MAG: TetR/AcrR family transcriptional regulator [Chloroflexota bacterium]